MSIRPDSSKQRDELVAQAIDDILNGRETKVQYRFEGRIEWHTPSGNTLLSTFTARSIEWRLKPEPIVRYINTYQTSIPHGLLGMECGSLNEINEIADKPKRNGYFKVIFEEGKDPRAEWVRI